MSLMSQCNDVAYKATLFMAFVHTYKTKQLTKLLVKKGNLALRTRLVFKRYKIPNRMENLNVK